MKKAKKLIKTRDYLMKRLIEGATKSGIHKDRKKDSNKKCAREKVEKDEIFILCKQCSFPVTKWLSSNPFDPINDFCSESCFDYHTRGN